MPQRGAGPGKGRDRRSTRAALPGKRARRRDRSSSAEDDGGQSRRHASANGRSTDYSAAASRSTQTPISPERMSSAHTHRDRRGTVGRSGKDGEADVARAPKPSSVHAPSPNPALVYERKPSMSTRPSSEIPSAADSANVKAKDAWEMDRLFKARSMAYGPDGEAIVSTPATIGSNTRPSTFISTDLQRVSSIPSVTALTDLHRTTSMPAPTHTHGSSHTYFVVQTPYQGAQSASYPQIPVPPPPILYSSSPQLAQAASSPTHQQYKTPLDRVPFPSANPTNDSSLTRPPLANPLPEPPRLSSYQVPPLPPSLSGAGDASASLEYWTQYANVQTTH
ncbi:hypothetical protein A0H81_00798 [Grifola frondosa]|uniref:Uncharacterized protein n=1 Tax=Grifola frondosa TaxID=5627 RepID=A0A1C7MRD5_GRIFR|nr:hypothetical protein A0H81_00798 [Grifola frondosa]